MRIPFGREVLIVVALAMSGMLQAQTGPWAVQVETPSDTIELGIPFEVRVTLENRSGGNIVMPTPLGLCGYCGLHIGVPSSDPGEECLGGLPCPAISPRPISKTKKWYGPGQVVVLRDDEHPPRCVGQYTITYSCEVPERVRQAERDFKTGATITNTEVWVGSFESDTVVVTAMEPEGIDREAYEVFGPGIVFDTRRHGELLRRFPTSTYAAYVVWKRWGRVTAGVWKDAEDRDKFLTWLSVDPDDEYLRWNLPCTADGRIDATVTTRLAGRVALECRDRWLDLVVNSHPDIWFADEMRLKLALDRYLLGDPAACAAGLEALAENGRADVAAKARDLLSAMRAKGMLPGEGTE